MGKRYKGVTLALAGTAALLVWVESLRPDPPVQTQAAPTVAVRNSWKKAVSEGTRVRTVSAGARVETSLSVPRDSHNHRPHSVVITRRARTWPAQSGWERVLIWSWQRR